MNKPNAKPSFPSLLSSNAMMAASRLITKWRMSTWKLLVFSQSCQPSPLNPTSLPIIIVSGMRHLCPCMPDGIMHMMRWWHGLQLSDEVIQDGRLMEEAVRSASGSRSVNTFLLPTLLCCCLDAFGYY
jgi:hypothetical protein